MKNIGILTDKQKVIEEVLLAEIDGQRLPREYL